MFDLAVGGVKNERDFNKGCATEPTDNFAGIELAVN
jgi:hypothetical protein